MTQIERHRQAGASDPQLVPARSGSAIHNLVVLCVLCVSALILPLFSGVTFAKATATNLVSAARILRVRAGRLRTWRAGRPRSGPGSLLTNPSVTARPRSNPSDLVAASGRAVQKPPRTVRVEPLRVRQGGLLFVSLQTREPIRSPSCEWLGNRYPMFETQGGYRTALPVDRLEKAGPASLTVRAAGIVEPLATRSLQIVALDTGPVQTVRLTPELMKAEQDPRIEEESKRIRALVSTQTATAFWSLGFRPPVVVPGRNFGTRRHYVEILPNGRRGSSFDGYHRGLDFPVGAGSPVHAAAAGVVLAAEPFILSGNSVLVDHGQGMITGYFHLSEFRVKVGQKIRQGDVVGLVGSTGRSTGPHLHWSVYAQGRAVNPMSILQLPAFFRIQGLSD